MRDRFSRFMIGRYGMDELTRFLSIAVMALMVLNLYLRLELLNMLVMAGIVVIYARMFSKNIQARYKENMKFLEIRDRIFGFFAGKKRRAADLKENHIYKCPSCGQKIRIPRGKGRIMVKCPSCKHEFEKKS